MQKRTRLRERILPCYSIGEELMNTITHICGGALGIAVLVLCVLRGVSHSSAMAIVTAAVFGGTMIGLYTVSSVYHALKPGMAKRVMQIIDHCAIYFLIAGTYTPIVLCAVAPLYPACGWGLFAAEWGLAILATTLTAIDLRCYRVFSMLCYIGMGWGIILFWPQAIAALTPEGFGLVFAGGVVYTIGAILYGIGSKCRWIHSVFHIFVVLGSLLHFWAIYLYVL